LGAVNDSLDGEKSGPQSADAPAQTNYFLQYISSSLENSAHKAEAASNKFVFGQNMIERVLEWEAKPPSLEDIEESNEDVDFVAGTEEHFSPEASESPPKVEASSDSNKENSGLESGSEGSSLENTPDKSNNISESLAESAAAYTKATAKRCLLEKVEVITGEEAESNVLQRGGEVFYD
ncbi:hypothetical protein AB205_0024350, partial [Aquarana catesbeiana]